MPTPDEELDQLLGGVAQPAQQAGSGQQSPDDELDALLGTSAPAPAPRKSHVIDMPTQTIEYTPPPPAPWYSRFLPNPTALAHGLAAGATMNWGEEGAGKLSAGLSSVLPGLSDPEGYERNYAAGSQSADMSANMEAENKELREKHPASFIGGEVAGSIPAAIGLGGVAGRVVRPLMGAAVSASPAAMAVGENMAAGALQGAASGSGADTEDRLRGAGRGALAGAAVSGGLQAAGSGLQAMGANADNVANRLLTQTFMTPAQRANYTLQKGPDALPKLGKDARDAGLFGGPLRRLLPTRARGVADRAVDVMQGSTGKIQKFEQELADQGINPDVSVKPIAERLRADAADFEVPVLGAEKDANLLHKQADLLEQPSVESVAGSVMKPPVLPTRPAPTDPIPVHPPSTPQPGEQLVVSTPRAMPERQIELNLPPRNRLAYSPEPTQLEMDLPRQQPTRQLDLGLEPTQAPLRLPPAEAAKLSGRPQSPMSGVPSMETAGAYANVPKPGQTSFAQQAYAAATNPNTAKFQNRRAYIDDLYRQMSEDGVIDGVTLDQFKQQLVDAHRRGELELTRADLTGAMDPRRLRNSKTSLDNSDFHFVNLDRPAPAASPLPSGGSAQEPMFLGTEPARPPAAPSAAPAPEQLAMHLPDRQMPLPLEGGGRPNPFRPEARPATQTELPVSEALPLPPRVRPDVGVHGEAHPATPSSPRGPQAPVEEPLPEATAQVARENIPLTDAMRLKRYLGKRIDWAKKPNAEHTGLGEDAAQKLTWKGISDQIDTALKGESGIDPTKLAEYNTARKNFHTAATAFEPALKMAEREGEIGLGARDFMAAQAFGGGPVGGLASMANKQLAGTMPSVASNAIRATGAGSKLAGLLRAQPREVLSRQPVLHYLKAPLKTRSEKRPTNRSRTNYELS